MAICASTIFHINVDDNINASIHVDSAVGIDRMIDDDVCMTSNTTIVDGSIDRSMDGSIDRLLDRFIGELMVVHRWIDLIHLWIG